MSAENPAASSADDVVVELKDVHAGYLPGVNILNGANLIARQGELIGIIGPNGAGKSTLLKSIFGMVNERLEFVTGIFAELGKRLKQRAGSLSGGERQMVAMSRALMMDPSVLLLDEPSAGLSPVRQDDAFIRVSDINKAGVTTIMVEQNARRCLQICDRGYVLDQGKDAYEGTGRDLLNDPKVIGLYLGTLGTDAA